MRFHVVNKFTSYVAPFSSHLAVFVKLWLFDKVTPLISLTHSLSAICRISP